MRFIIIKELREHLYNPRFMLALSAAGLLILVSLFSGYVVYHNEREYAAERERAGLDDMRRPKEAYMTYAYTAVRYPSKLSIFDVGISGNVNRIAWVRSSGFSQFSDTRYESDPQPALFGEFDLTFTVVNILSLFAILFSFSSVPGERESGTLRLLLSNSISRPSVILGKIVGGYVPLALLLILPLVLGLICLSILADTSLTPDEWLRIGVLVGAYLLYLLLFHCLGVAVGALCRSSFVSFTICFLVWIACIAVIPKVSVQVANRISPSDNPFEFDYRMRMRYLEVYQEVERRRVEFYRNNLVTKENQRQMDGRFADDEENDRRRMTEGLEFKLLAEFQRSRRSLMNRVIELSRLSPSSCLVYISHNLAESGPRMLDKFEDDIRAFQAVYKPYSDKEEEKRRKLREESGALWVYDIVEGPDGRAVVELHTLEKFGQDLSGMPRFSPPAPTADLVVFDSLIELGALAFSAILLAAIAYVAFLKYDPR